MSRDEMKKRLKSARDMYVFHASKNHTQARGVNLLYFGRECLKYRDMLEAHKGA